MSSATIWDWTTTRWPTKLSTKLAHNDGWLARSCSASLPRRVLPMLRSFRFGWIAPFAVVLVPLFPHLESSTIAYSAKPDNDFVYVAGTMGTDPTTGEFADGVAGQFAQAMENISVALAAEEMDFTHVVSVNVFLSDTRLFGEMNEIYRSYFPVDPPTRATVGVDLPHPEALVQIAMIAARPQVKRSVVKPTRLKSPELPYSWGVLAGNTLFIAGATSRHPDTYQPVQGDVGLQTRRVFGNIGAVLEEAGMDYGDLVTCTVFLNDPREFGTMNGAYRESVTEIPPARATVRARLVNPAFKVEIQCIAVRGPARSLVIAEGATRPSSPFSPAIRAGQRLYTAGMVGRGPDGIELGAIEAQTRQTLHNLAGNLSAAGLGFEHVTAVSVFLPHISHAEPVDALIDQIVGTDHARTVIGAELMGPDLLVEIMMVAAGGDS